MKIKTRFAVAGFTALVGVVSFSTSASAASSHEWVYTSDGSPYGGIARWTENGDGLETCDNEADGWGVDAMIYRVGGSGVPLIENINTGGNGHCNIKSKNIPENIELDLMVCLEKNNGRDLRHCTITNVRWF